MPPAMGRLQNAVGRDIIPANMSLMAQVNTTVFTISFAAYTLAIVVVGLYSARFARRSDEDYFLAGRSLGPGLRHSVHPRRANRAG